MKAIFNLQAHAWDLEHLLKSVNHAEKMEKKYMRVLNNKFKHHFVTMMWLQ